MSLSSSSNSSRRSSSRLTPSNSTSISAQQSARSDDDNRVEDIAPAGRFDIGLNQTAQAKGTSACNAASTDRASASATTDDAPPHAPHASRPTCPQPVLLLIRGLALVGGGDLCRTIYGGITLMTPVDPRASTSPSHPPSHPPSQPA